MELCVWYELSASTKRGIETYPNPNRLLPMMDTIQCIDRSLFNAQYAIFRSFETQHLHGPSKPKQTNGYERCSHNGRRQPVLGFWTLVKLVFPLSLSDQPTVVPNSTTGTKFSEFQAKVTVLTLTVDPLQQLLSFQAAYRWRSVQSAMCRNCRYPYTRSEMHRRIGIEYRELSLYRCTVWNTLAQEIESWMAGRSTEELSVNSVSHIEETEGESLIQTWRRDRSRISIRALYLSSLNSCRSLLALFLVSTGWYVSGTRKPITTSCTAAQIRRW